jgi:hypothetical protein
MACSPDSEFPINDPDRKAPAVSPAVRFRERLIAFRRGHEPVGV